MKPLGIPITLEEELLGDYNRNEKYGVCIGKSTFQIQKSWTKWPPCPRSLVQLSCACSLERPVGLACGKCGYLPAKCVDYVTVE